MKKLFVLGLSMLSFSTIHAAPQEVNLPSEELLSFDIDTLWVLMSAALVFFMQAGFKCLEVGFVRQHHIAAVAMKNMVDWVIGSVIFFLLGFGLMFGHSAGGWLGIDMFLPNSFDVVGGNKLGAVFFMFQLAFTGTALTIVSGAMSERTGFIPYLTASIFIALIIYPVFGHWVWGNLFYEDNTAWLADLGFIDFAGSTVVHSVGAWVSLAGLKLLGPRLGRYTEDGKLRPFQANSIPMAVLGVFILWFGWWGFNGGSTLALNQEVGKIILNTNLSGAAAALSAYFFAYFFQHKEDIYEKMLGGALGGLVAITASPHIQTPLTSLLIGLLAGIIHNLSYDLLTKKWKIDDAVGAIPVHGFCGLFGTLAVALFAPAETLVHGRWVQLGIQALGAAVCMVWAGGTGYVLFYMLKKTVGLRVSPDEERKGITLYHVKDEPENMEDDEEIMRLMQEIG
ncbi:ammonium transporter [Catalinimonas niigatensis]|uniref:ammonium transporter n=1 Tax=Catalinimonas niigatensis TaxID=1397264 RepID=UPI002665E371|nr:ammonium transporter [Catalinimonas niigatensis]WPP48431.1 ammonium transporter [Catalinimonas niigatensis]